MERKQERGKSKTKLKCLAQAVGLLGITVCEQGIQVILMGLWEADMFSLNACLTPRRTIL